MDNLKLSPRVLVSVLKGAIADLNRQGQAICLTADYLLIKVEQLEKSIPGSQSQGCERPQDRNPAPDKRI